MFCQAHNAEAGPEALLRVGSTLHDMRDELLCLGTVLCGPVDDPGRGPFQIPLMGLGHVLMKDGKAPLPIASLVAGHPLVFEEDLNGGCRHLHIDLFPGKLIGNTVKVAVDLDMVVDIDFGLFPRCVFIGFGWKGFEGGFIDGFEEFPAGGLEFLELAVVELYEFPGNGAVEFSHAEEGMVSRSCQDPTLRYEDGRFRLGLASGTTDSGRDDRRGVMFGKVLIGGIDVRFISARVVHTGFEVVRNKDLGYAAEELEGVNMGSDPEREFLGRGGLGKGIAAGAKGGDKDLSLGDFSGYRIDDGNGLPALVDKELLSGPMFLPERDIEFVSPLPIEVAELTVLIPVRIGLLVFVPE